MKKIANCFTVKEVEDLYQNISKFALLNGLSIINLRKVNQTCKWASISSIN